MSLSTADRPVAEEEPRTPTIPVTHSELPGPADDDRRRFIVAVTVATAVMAIPMLWLLWDLWSGSPNPLRGVPYDNFYDLQARAMFAGRLNIPPGYMGIEAFLHDGKQYTYFGIFPSLIRMPILLFTNRFDGELTAPSILVAWLATSLVSSLMLWRLRILMRGRVALGRAEAVSYGLLMATIMGGSVILFLAATPFIYNEDFAWSVPLTVGSLFCLLGVMERPSWRRVLAAGVLVLCANLDRTPTGYACVIAALLVAGWFALGWGGVDRQRWAWPMVAVGVVPFLASCAVTYAKFGIPVGLPMADQVWTSVNAHRRYFLAANGGKAFSFGFLPSTLDAYFQPFGIHFSGLFPFVSPPTSPAKALGGAVLDQTYPTASLPATMPLLFVLGIWGTIAAFRPKGPGQVRLTRIILAAAAAGSSGVLLWGYISERYMADLMPFFIVAAGIGLIDCWHRLAGKGHRVRIAATAVAGALATYCVVVNLAIAAFPVSQWTPAQAVDYVSAQNALSTRALTSTAEHGSTVPYWAPAGKLFIAGDCAAMYLSTGNSLKNVPGQQIQHFTWIPVEQGPGIIHTIGFTFNQPESALTHPITLLTYGAASLVLRPASPAGYVQFVVEHSGTSIPWPSPVGWHFPIKYLHSQYKLTVTTDPYLNQIVVTWYGTKMIGHYVAGDGPAVVHVTPTSTTGTTPVVTVRELPTPTPDMSLCQSILHGT